MTITLKPEQEKVLIQAINSGLAHNTDEALDQACDALRARLPHDGPVDESVAAAALTLGNVRETAWPFLGRLDDRGTCSREQAVTRFVLDASTVLTWCFPDEKAQNAQEISEKIAGGGTVVVPAFWLHEVLNALLVGERRESAYTRTYPSIHCGFEPSAREC